MKVYIRDYLRKIPIIDQLYRMIVRYGQLYSEEEKDNYDDYRYSISGDDVLRFLDYVLPGYDNLEELYPRKLRESDEDWITRLKSVDDFANRFPLSYSDLTADEWIYNLVQTRRNYISYLKRMFYSVKGTYKVLDFILDYDLFQTSKGKDLQEPDISTKISYSARSIEIVIEDLPAELDRDIFCEYLERFLCALLYFESLKITINNTKVIIEDDTTVSLNHGEIFFRYYEAGKPVESSEPEEEEEEEEEEPITPPDEEGDDEGDDTGDDEGDDEDEGGDDEGDEGNPDNEDDSGVEPIDDEHNIIDDYDEFQEGIVEGYEGSGDTEEEEENNVP